MGDHAPVRVLFASTAGAGHFSPMVPLAQACAAAGHAVAVAAPWLFGFADEGANVWAPFVVVGVAAIFLGLTTKQEGGYSYRKSSPTTA